MSVAFNENNLKTSHCFTDCRGEHPPRTGQSADAQSASDRERFLAERAGTSQGLPNENYSTPHALSAPPVQLYK